MFTDQTYISTGTQNTFGQPHTVQINNEGFTYHNRLENGINTVFHNVNKQ